MSFATDYIGQLEKIATRMALPRVRSLHLPPAGEPDDDVGEFCAIELDDGSIGLSYVLFNRELRQESTAADRLGIEGMDPLQLARAYASEKGLRKTVGFAAANALTRCFYDRVGYVPEPSRDSIGGLDPVAGEHVGMIGFFKPLLQALTVRGSRLTILELKAELAGDNEGYRVTLDPQDLADCTQALATGTILLNDTLDAILGACRHARRMSLIGPSVGCLPDALFQRGVTSVGGAWVMDAPAYIDALRRGESRSAFSRKFAINREDYPGFADLLATL